MIDELPQQHHQICSFLTSHSQAYVHFISCDYIYILANHLILNETSNITAFLSFSNSHYKTIISPVIDSQLNKKTLKQNISFDFLGSAHEPVISSLVLMVQFCEDLQLFCSALPGARMCVCVCVCVCIS